MVVRKAREADAAAIRAVTAAVCPARIPEDLAADSGFLLTAHSEDTYARRAAEGDFFYVAEDGGAIGGFLMAYSRPRFEPLLGGAYSEDTAYGWILRHGPADVVLLDQIGVLPEWRRRGTAARLYERFAEEAAGRRCLLTILHEPVMNLRSRGFFEGKQGYRLMREFRGPCLTWGLYENAAVR